MSEIQMKTILRLTLGYLVDFRVRRKMLIAPEWNKAASTALHRSKENDFLYRMVTLEVKIESRMFSEYCSHHSIED
jgi:hypothetical protein